MSLDARLKTITCDNSDCGEALPLPLAVHSGHSARVPRPPSAEAGWVFIAGTYEVRHYCPQCAGKVLPIRAA